MPDAAQARLSPHPTTIRAVALDDVPALKAVIDATGLFPSELLEGMLAGYLDGIASEDLWLTTADGVGHQPFSVAYCAPERMTSGTSNLLLVAVHPDRQRRGYGAMLAARMERSLAARGERVLLVETSALPAFAPARAFYTRCGYDEEARIRDYYRPGDDKIIYRKVLAQANAGTDHPTRGS